tara:strand:+ start:340 stop:531 length:192 start_codon:yes stop_codon:yes gene_type:complete
MNYFNYSDAQYLVSSVIATVATLFFITVPKFGFDLHGYQSCPKKHFKCGQEIKVDKLLFRING